MSEKKIINQHEFIVLMAMMISVVALAIDIMLPALNQIAVDLGEQNANRAQLVVSALFFGFAIGQIIVGPISDCYGRKPVVYFSYLLFIVGCLLSIWAENYELMLLGRVLQGVGAAGPRVLSVAIVRDGYEGRAMARILSIVMSVFILVPAIAPAVGQGIIVLVDWRACFWFLLVVALITLVWFATRQPETLPQPKRRVFSIKNIVNGIGQVCQTPTAVGYTLSAGLLFGAFLGYLNSANQIFMITYQQGDLFALYFGLAALAIGSASMMNAKLVMNFGMRLLSRRAYYGICLFSLVFLFPVFIYQGVPPFPLFMSWLLITFFFVGILFGNLNALAMQPLGDMAGLGAAFVGAVSTLVSLPFGWFIGNQFSGGITALVLGFLILGLAALSVMLWTERQSLA